MLIEFSLLTCQKEGTTTCIIGFIGLATFYSSLIQKLLNVLLVYYTIPTSILITYLSKRRYYHLYYWIYWPGDLLLQLNTEVAKCVVSLLHNTHFNSHYLLVEKKVLPPVLLDLLAW